MAKILNKDPEVYNRERDAFMRELHHFHDTRGTKFRRSPAITGREVDLYLLYNLVTARGGWIKVTNRNQWNDLIDKFNLPKTCINGGVALKQIYVRYLDRYEKSHYTKDENDRGNDDDEDNRHKRWSSRAIHTVPLTYNHLQHSIAESMRSHNGLSSDLHKQSDYDKLLLSLVSPLPNEQDFALNICTLLANENKTPLRLDKCPRMIDYLLAHAGIFNHSSLRNLFKESYSNIRGHTLNSFWTDVLRVDSFEDLMNENKFIKLKRKTVLPVLNAFIKRERGNQAPGASSSIVKKEEKKEASATATKDTSEIVASAAVEKIEIDAGDVDTKVSGEESASAAAPMTSEGDEITNAAGPVDETKNCESEVGKCVSETSENAEGNKDSEAKSSENAIVSNTDAKSDVVKSAEDSIIESEVKDSSSSDVRSETVEDTKDSLSSDVRSEKVDDSKDLKSEKVDDSKDSLNSDVKSVNVSDSNGSSNSDLRTENVSDTQGSLGPDVRNTSEAKASLESRSEIVKDSLSTCSVTPKEEFSEPQPCCSKDIPPNFIDLDNDPNAIKENEVPKTVECPVTTNDSSDDSDLFAPSDEDSSSGKQKFKLKIEPSDLDLFDLGRTLGTQEYVGQRVMQIANILRNLSFVEENVSVLANNITFLRFLLLCVSSRWNSLHQCGFDTLTNIASELLVKDPIRDRLTECLMYTVTQGLASEDRFVIISSLDVLNKLSQNEANEDVLIRYLEQNVYEQVCVYLTVHDIMMLVYTLECLYSLSSLGERSCNSISRVHGIYDVLVALVTVEAQSYGQKACISMKVVETVPPGGTPILIPPQSSTVSQPATLTSPTYTNLCSNTNLMTSISMPAPLQPQMTPTFVPQPPKSPIPISTQTVTNVRTITSFAPIRTTSAQQIQQITSVQMPTVVQVQQPPPIIAQPPVSVPQPPQPQQPANINPLQAQAQSSQQLVQQQHAHQQAIQENEQFALTWLRATCEPDMVGKIEQQELYKNYLNSCAKIGRRGVIAPLHFPRIVRSVFGGTVGPNPSKTEPNMQYYDGIKMRAKPLIIATPQPVTTQPTVLTTVKTTSRRTKTPTIVSSISSIESTINEVATPPQSPASPILKAQLSAPAKKESPVKTNETKNQASTHPHLSQALMGAAVPTSNTTSPVTTGGGSTATNTTTAAPCSSANTAAQTQSSSSLIKSLLATKVNECMLTGGGSMKPATATVITSDCAPAVATQVAQRQQRLLAAQQNPVTPTPQQPATQTNVTKCAQKPKEIARINGARPQDAELVDSLVSSSTASDNRTSPQSLTNMRGRQAPPPLAPLSALPKQSKMDTDDSDSVGNSSVASSSGIVTSHITVGPDNITDDGDNSLTSFESLLLNGIPNSIDIDAPCNDDVSVSPRPPKTKTQSLMLADLLEKKIDKKDPPLINGLLCRELRIGDKGLELVENHIEKVLNEIPNNQDGQVSVIVSSDSSETNRAIDSVANNAVVKMDEQIDTEAMEVDSVVSPLKRPAEEQLPAEAKRPHLSSVIVSNSNVNGTASREISPNKETVVKEENATNNSDDNEIGNVSSTAANLYAALAADALEDEDDLIQPQEEIKQEQQPQFVQVVQAGKNSQQQPQQQQQLIVHAPRQIIVSQAQIGTTGQVLFTAGGQIIQQGGSAGTATIKAPVGHQTLPVLVQAGQNASQQRVVLQQVMQHSTGGVQLVASGSQPGQYVISSGGAQGQTTYMMAQPQTAIVQGQPQTVLVAQTGQHQVSGAKTIIILQSQTAAPPQATHHQKVVVTPQGQQVVVTQVPRPVLQSSAISSVVPPPSLIAPNVSKNPAVQQQTVITSNSSNAIKSTQPCTSAAFSAVTSTQCNVNTIVTTAVIGNACNTATKMNVSSSASVLNKDNKLNTFSVNAKIETPVSTSAKTPRNAGKATLKQLNAAESLFICEWKDCKIKEFKSANEVLLHAIKAHCPECETEIQCLWERCDNMKRKRLSLMTHLMDRHCNTEAMKQSAVRRKQLSLSGRTEVTAPPPPTPHPGYAPDAALHAIKRHALEFVNPKELMQQRADKQPPAAPVPAPQIGTTSATDQDENEGPVTKSIRLTASLILRNLVIYANNSRRYLRHYESHLASIALSNVESSRTIAQVLYDMNDSGGHR